jgi:hypothetical protein
MPESMAGMKKNVILFTPDGKTTHYANIQDDHIDERGILSQYLGNALKRQTVGQPNASPKKTKEKVSKELLSVL